MKKNTGNTAVNITIIIAVILVSAWLFWGRPSLENSNTTTASSTATVGNSVAHINGKDISLIVVDTPETRETGLGNRAGLPQDQAMLFVFEKPDKYEFWMKDMKFPLDMIWLDPNFKVVYIQTNISPDTYPDITFMPDQDALYVLEANAGFAAQNSLKIGDVVQVSLKK